MTEIPINRLTFYQSRVLEQNENLKNKNSSLDIDFDQTDKWMIADTGYYLRNQTNF